MAEPERRRSYVLAGIGLLAAAGVAYLSGHKSGGVVVVDEVDIRAIGNGSVLVDGQPAPQKLVEPAGSTVHFQAMPAAGWVFSHWQGSGGSSTDNPLVVKLDTATGEIAAVFQQSTATPGPSHALPIVRMGSIWVNRAGWVRDHGSNGPLYGANGLLAGWIPFGTRLQTTGPQIYMAVGWIGADGSSCCAAGRNPMYPVAGGFVAPIDVDVVG